MVKLFSNIKNGELSLTLIVVLILTVIFLISAIPMITKFNSPTTILSLQEWRCSFSLKLDQLPVFAAAVKPWCSTSIVKFDKQFIKKQQDKGETEKDAAMRFILNKMLTCKEIFEGPKAAGFMSSKSCYICYSLETDKTTPFITGEDLLSASLRMETASGLDYNTEIRKDGHTIVPDLQDGLGVSPKPGTLDSSKNYGITYVTVSKGSLGGFAKDAGIYGGACLAGAGLGFAIGIIPVVGPLIGVSAASSICYISLSAGATDYYLFDYFELGKDTGVILLTDYKTLERKECGTVVSG